MARSSSERVVCARDPDNLRNYHRVEIDADAADWLGYHINPGNVFGIPMNYWRAEVAVFLDSDWLLPNPNRDVQFCCASIIYRNTEYPPNTHPPINPCFFFVSRFLSSFQSSSNWSNPSHPVSLPYPYANCTNCTNPRRRTVGVRRGCGWIVTAVSLPWTVPAPRSPPPRIDRSEKIYTGCAVPVPVGNLHVNVLPSASGISESRNKISGFPGGGWWVGGGRRDAAACGLRDAIPISNKASSTQHTK